MADIPCPDCDDTRGGLSSYGNGKCRHCDGKGYTYEVVDHIIEFTTMGNVDSETPCSYCHSTGTCQTCDGKGYIEE